MTALEQIITIDGLSLSGKSLLAPRVAEYLGWFYFETGLLYRGLAYALFEQDFVEIQPQGIDEALNLLEFTCDNSGKCIQITYCQKVLKEKHLHTPALSQWTGILAQDPYVRQKLLFVQRLLLQKFGPLVAHGRDTGSQIFPQALWRFYVHSDMGTRAQRYCELNEIEPTPAALAQVITKIDLKDKRDMWQEAEGLLFDPQAKSIDMSSLTVEQSLEKVLERVYQLTQ